MLKHATMTEASHRIEGETRPGRWLLTCDHATNLVPDWVSGGDLGLPPEDMQRHIAYDIGAAGLTSRLGELLDSPAIFSCFSRLVIDPNRGEDDPTVLMKVYDGSVVPGNRHADAAEKERRLATLHRPYHDAISALIDARDDPLYCAIHSFTPRLRGRPARPWEIGVLYAEDDRLARPLIAAFREAGWVTGDNEPYKGNLPGDSVDRHAVRTGRPNVLIELRQDLIAEADGQALWAERLAPILTDVLKHCAF